MPRFELGALVALTALIVPAGCAARPPHATTHDHAASSRAAWTWMTASLPGNWTAATSDGRRVRESFRLASNNSVLVETFTTASGRETVTVYHPDGDGLMLTHYCAQGNQPRLRMFDAAGDRARFAFVDATNLRDGQEVMVERVLQLRGDALEQSETYRQPNGTRETTVFRFVRETSAPP